MNEFRADLHCHTTCSDGTLDPEAIVFHAKELGLSGLCITDHDSINAYITAIPAAKSAGLALGAGVEFSSVNEGLSVHLLGYDVDLESEALHSLCTRHVQRRKNRNQKILDKLKAKGIDIPYEELGGTEHTIGRPHIATALISKGIVKSVQEAFNVWIGDGKPCFDPGEPISTDETIEIIHEAGGKAFIAHPHLYPNPKMAKKLLDKPIDGIECYYSKCPPNQEKRWVDVAKERGLLISGGSDFHGAIKPQIPLGCSWVSEEIFNQIFDQHRCC